MSLKELTREAIEKMPAGPEMDALVAEILGYNVLGITHCWPDHECFGYDVPYELLEDCEISWTELRPVYLDHCVCEFAKPDDKRYWEHGAGCLGVVPEYSLEDMYAFDIVDWLVEQDYRVNVTVSPDGAYCQIYKLRDKDFFANLYEAISYGIGETRPLAICRSLLSLYKEGGNIKENLK